MAEPSPEKMAIGAIGPLITTAIGAAIGWPPGGLTGAIGSPSTVLLAAVGRIGGLVFSLMYQHRSQISLSSETGGECHKNARDRRDARGCSASLGCCDRGTNTNDAAARHERHAYRDDSGEHQRSSAGTDHLLPAQEL